MTKPLRFENKSLRLKYKCLICIWIIVWAILDLFINPKYLFQNKSVSQTYYSKSEKSFVILTSLLGLKINPGNLESMSPLLIGLYTHFQMVWVLFKMRVWGVTKIREWSDHWMWLNVVRSVRPLYLLFLTFRAKNYVTNAKKSRNIKKSSNLQHALLIFFFKNLLKNGWFYIILQIYYYFKYQT